MSKRLSDKLPATFQSVVGYRTPSCSLEAAARCLRRALMSKHCVATTFGYGPRYLHATGRLRKGGPNTGIFLELADRMVTDMPALGKLFWFGALAQAQAASDLESLRTHHRHANRAQLRPDKAATVNGITAVLRAVLSSRQHATLRQRCKVAHR